MAASEPHPKCDNNGLPWTLSKYNQLWELRSEPFRKIFWGQKHRMHNTGCRWHSQLYTIPRLSLARAGRIVVRAEKYKVAKVMRRKPEMYSKTAKERNMATLVFG